MMFYIEFYIIDFYEFYRNICNDCIGKPVFKRTLNLIK